MKEKLNKFYTPWNLLILIILLFAFILRIYRIGDLLDFHYDQGRDALIIWELIKNHKFFLIGPVTGLEGIFLGPFYYYLIAPFYLIGHGNPAIPSIFLSFLVTISLYFLYKSGEEIGGKATGFIALLIGSFSNYLILSSRWLSNPTPIYLTSILIFYLMIKIIKEKDNKPIFWILMFLLVGVSFHFELASAIFYLPILLIFSFWQKKKLNKLTIVLSLSLLIITFLPQVIFNFRHENILFNNILFQITNHKDGQIEVNLLQFLQTRIKRIWDIISSLIFNNNILVASIFLIISLFGIFKLKKNNEISKLFAIFLGIPLIGYLLYRGNYGNLYNYYLTGYFLIFVLFFSWGISYFFKISPKRIILIFILLILLNLIQIKTKLTTNINNSNEIFIQNQLEAINWIYEDSIGNNFNVDIYVPPVISYSYDYLFLWEKNIRNNDNPKLTEKFDLLYTLYEVDPPHPDRLEAWLARQKGIGKVEKEIKFGGITVQRRIRI
ncbi:MAG: glycosyltransferase family 39 protein [Candidatus Woesebacteria bacterium]|nr:glycosyltransferase family 39 protein [Candidatus Woesebacteria bacterium]